RDGRVVHRLNGGAGWIPLPLAAVPEDAWAIHSVGHRLYVVGRQQLFVYDPDGRVLATIDGLRPLRDSAVDGHGLLLLFADGALARLAAGAHWLDMLPPAPPIGALEGYIGVLPTLDGGRALIRRGGGAVVLRADGTVRLRLRTLAGLAPLVAQPPIGVDRDERFALPAAMLSACPRLPLPPPKADPLAARHDGGIVFDRDGAPLPPDPAAMAPAAIFERHGWWLSTRLDGGRDARVWRVGRLQLAALPPGTTLTVGCYTSDDPEALPEDLAPEAVVPLFRTALTYRAPAQRGPGETAPRELDFHVSAPPGRYLWLRIALEADGRDTPRIDAIEITYGGPRWLDLMPAVFQAQEPMRDMLERLFGLLALGIATPEQLLRDAPLMLDPRFTNDRLLAALEQWFAIPPDPRLTPEARRHLLYLRLQNAAALGTKEGLRARLSALVATLSGLSVDEVTPTIRLVEGFERRTSRRLGAATGHRLGRAVGIIGGTGLTIGETVIDSRTDPTVADFQRHAHRLDIVLPRALAPDGVAEDMLRRAIAEEVPAHIAWQLQRHAGGIRLDGDATLGIGTTLTDARVVRLGCSAPATPPSCLPRLGIDAKLGGSARGNDGPPRTLTLAPTPLPPAASRLI
ncbi:MAG: hypothetical protein AAF675_13055, partial [Pseudomonadota bacterium]